MTDEGKGSPIEASDQLEATDHPRADYQAPELVDLGTIQEMTQGNTGATADGIEAAS